MADKLFRKEAEAKLFDDPEKQAPRAEIYNARLPVDVKLQGHKAEAARALLSTAWGLTYAPMISGMRIAEARLPIGWRIAPASGHFMLLDFNGRERARVVDRTMFGGSYPPAFIEPLPRYHVLSAYDDSASESVRISVFDRETGRAVRSSEWIAGTHQNLMIRRRDELLAWLEEARPDHGNPLRHWSDLQATGGKK
ncbi:hypothetical protein ACQUFY_04565 [Robbsia andropogonis]|uniref:hypothetical protein n=1 Tax=Robbsia andropogonis TaxID=28092 RepID=UPI003D22A408